MGSSKNACIVLILARAEVRNMKGFRTAITKYILFDPGQVGGGGNALESTHGNIDRQAEA